MTRQQQQESRLAALRLQRDTAGAEVLARMKNGIGTQLALQAINERVPGWQAQFLKLRDRMDFTQATALDHYVTLCENVRQLQRKYQERNAVRACPGSSTVNPQKILCPPQ